jgi:hypothetical protein
VLAPGRRVLGLLDPARGLGPKEITTIAEAYGGAATIFKRDAPGETIAGVADEFLAAVREAAAGDASATIVVLGHGLPTEIQSYGIRFERVADALLDGAARRMQAGAGRTIDLGTIVLVCDDCFSADFLINLLDGIESRCRARGLALGSLPACIAGTNRACVGHADVGEKFVPHFWRDVIELYFIRKPLPEAVTLGDFFEKVDNMMYGYGRAPIVEDGRVSGYRLVDPELVQDPVVFVPSDDDDLASLAQPAADVLGDHDRHVVCRPDSGCPHSVVEPDGLTRRQPQLGRRLGRGEGRDDVDHARVHAAEVVEDHRERVEARVVFEAGGGRDEDAASDALGVASLLGGEVSEELVALRAQECGDGVPGVGEAVEGEEDVLGDEDLLARDTGAGGCEGGGVRRGWSHHRSFDERGGAGSVAADTVKPQGGRYHGRRCSGDAACGWSSG